jgi:hypothetical protein
MKNKIGTWGLSSGIEEILDMPVVRKYVDMEWLSKISSSQFKSWETNSHEILRRSEKDEAKIDKLINEEIERREKLYQLYKERRVLEKERDRIAAEQARMGKHMKTDLLYGKPTFDIVSSPGTKKAVLQYGIKHRRDKYTPIGYGKVEEEYYNDLAKNEGDVKLTGTTKQHYDLKDWMCGGTYTT